MTRHSWLWAVFVGCGGVELPPPDPAAVACDDAHPVAVVGPEVADEARMADGTELRVCRSADGVAHGAHVEVFPGGGVAVKGAWAEGKREGTWTRWRPSGAFRARTDYRAGVPHGLRQRLGGDGRVVQMDLVEGVLMGLRSLPRARPMPEWKDGQPAEGLAHLDPEPSTDPAKPEADSEADED